MKISVINFKAIDDLKDFEIKPLTILCGTNSCGKSSLIQLILMLKQTLENTEDSFPLILNKPFASLGKYKNIIHNGILKEILKIKINIPPEEVITSVKSYLRRMFGRNYFKNFKELEVDVAFEYVSSKLHVKELFINIDLGTNNHWIRFARVKGIKYKITSNSMIFNNETYRDIIKNTKLDYDIETYYELFGDTYFNKFIPELFDVDEDEELDFYLSPFISYIKKNLDSIFKKISYVGPLREEPHLYYYNESDAYLKVGNKGEFAAHILATRAKDPIKFYKIEEDPAGKTIYVPFEDTLEAAVNYWICNVFQMAKKIAVVPKVEKTIYSIELTNNHGLKVPINHVGFGVSQILPIIVEGLLLGNKSVMILEQPEIHLHPRVQSLMFDFLHSLTLTGKFIIIETHSDHFITRMRRRVVEDLSNNIYKSTNLTFIQSEGNLNNYQQLEMNQFANLSYWPEGFLDGYDKDLRAIVKAQAQRKIALGNK